MVIWAVGQFFLLEIDLLGADLALHSSKFRTDDLEGDEFTVIGGYERVDAALNLVDL